MSDNVLFIKDFINRKDLELLAVELIERWDEEKYNILDQENKWWSDEIEYEFYEEILECSHLSETNKKYVLKCIGY